MITSTPTTVVSKPMSKSAARRKATALTYSTNVVHQTQWYTDGTWAVIRLDGVQFGCICTGSVCTCR